MASNTSNCNAIMHLPTYASDPTSPNTTFVQADPSNFRAVVQKLTGAPDDPSALKLPLTLKPAHHHTTRKPTNTTAAAAAAAAAAEMGPRKPTFKLRERRHATKKLELNIEHAATFNKHCVVKPSFNSGPSSAPSASSSGSHVRQMIFSPVSPLELYGRGSPRTPHEVEEEEERVIYLHPSPLSTPRGSDPPELLPLFPLHSPRDLNHNSYSH